MSLEYLNYVGCRLFAVVAFFLLHDEVRAIFTVTHVTAWQGSMCFRLIHTNDTQVILVLLLVGVMLLRLSIISRIVILHNDDLILIIVVHSLPLGLIV
jgi:hypothetical protein